MAALLTLLAVIAAVAAASATYIWGWEGEWPTTDGWRRWAYAFEGKGMPLIDSGRRWTMGFLERVFGEGVAEAGARAGLEAAGRGWERLTA